jgi:hypothetical protein
VLALKNEDALDHRPSLATEGRRARVASGPHILFSGKVRCKVGGVRSGDDWGRLCPSCPGFRGHRHASQPLPRTVR